MTKREVIVPAVDYDCTGPTINKLMSKHGVRKQNCGARMDKDGIVGRI